MKLTLLINHLRFTATSFFMKEQRSVCEKRFSMTNTQPLYYKTAGKLGSIAFICWPPINTSFSSSYLTPLAPWIVKQSLSLQS